MGDLVAATIKSIHVENFRSIKSIDAELSQLAIFVGKNDCGKSNILRALNLFFNGETNPGVEFAFDIEATGFTMGEIDLRIEGVETMPDNDPDDAELGEEPGVPVNRSGDLWQLGLHRLLCGDALDEANWARRMAGKKAAMTCSDFPYNVKINGHVSGLGEVRHPPFLRAVRTRGDWRTDQGQDRRLEE